MNILIKGRIYTPDVILSFYLHLFWDTSWPFKRFFGTCALCYGGGPRQNILYLTANASIPSTPANQIMEHYPKKEVSKLIDYVWCDIVQDLNLKYIEILGSLNQRWPKTSEKWKYDKTTCFCCLYICSEQSYMIYMYLILDGLHLSSYLRPALLHRRHCVGTKENGTKILIQFQTSLSASCFEW